MIHLQREFCFNDIAICSYEKILKSFILKSIFYLNILHKEYGTLVDKRVSIHDNCIIFIQHYTVICSKTLKGFDPFKETLYNMSDSTRWKTLTVIQIACKLMLSKGPQGEDIVTPPFLSTLKRTYIVNTHVELNAANNVHKPIQCKSFAL